MLTVKKKKPWIFTFQDTFSTSASYLCLGTSKLCLLVRNSDIILKAFLTSWIRAVRSAQLNYGARIVRLCCTEITSCYTGRNISFEVPKQFISSWQETKIRQQIKSQHLHRLYLLYRYMYTTLTATACVRSFHNADWLTRIFFKLQT